MDYDAVIVGAGLCGLTAAYRLLQENPHYKIAVIESQNRVGGVISSINIDGYRIESGPNTFVSTGKSIMALCNELDLIPVPASPLAKNRYILHRHKLHSLPSSPLRFIKSGLLSPQAKLKLLLEPFQSPNSTKNEESIADFARRRLGTEVLEKMLGPFLSGVYAGDPEQLSLQAVFPKLAQWEKESGSLLKGILQSRKEEKKQSGNHRKPYQLLSFETGMGSLPETLAHSLPENVIQLNTSVESVHHTGSQFQLVLSSETNISTQALILATPAFASARLLASITPEVAQLLNKIEYVPLTVTHFGFPKNAISHPLDGFGFLIPRSEHVPLLGCIWASTLFQNRAPEGHVLLSCYTGGALDLDLMNRSDENCIQQSLQDLQTIFKSPQLSPTFCKHIRYRSAIPQYSLGHLERIQHITEALSNTAGLFLAGNYLTGVSVDNCVEVGNKAAHAVIQHLDQAPAFCLKV